MNEESSIFYYLQAEVSLEECLYLLDYRLLLFLPVPTAEPRHRREYLVNVCSGGSYLPVPETVVDESPCLLRSEMLAIYDFLQVLIFTLLNKVFPALLNISIGIHAADKVLYEFFLAPELDA